MPNPRKLFISNTLTMVAFRTEEGLPLLPLNFINKIIKSALSRAYELYNVEVGAFTFELNHAHLMIRVTNPENVSAFVGYVKQETAHAINRLIGRRKKTIWSDGFDSPTILDSQTALSKFAYVLLNPVKDQLVDDMSKYPGVASYSMLMEDKNSFSTERIFRDEIVRVKNPHKPWLEEDTYTFDSENVSSVKFKIFPYSWKHCFADTKDLSDSEIRKKILEVLKQELAKIEIKHSDPNRLKRGSLLTEYVPKKFGRRMICLSVFKSYRQQFIKFFKFLCSEAEAILQDWRSGNFRPFPLGLFPPSQPRSANLVPDSISFW